MCKVIAGREYQLTIVNSLPTIVVAGNQSSGKSSLIEAISGVSLT
jgi:GTP1/Obg family GTP-binding protein